MTPQEEASFRAVYAGWPTERLVRASTLEKKDYRPETFALILEELNKRGFAEERLPEVLASMPPPLVRALPQRDRWLFPARLSRGKYTIRAFVFLVTIVAVGAALEMFPVIQPEGFTMLLFAVLVYGAIGLLLPRSKDAGFSPGFLGFLLFLFPITGFGAFVWLFFKPSKT